MPEIVQESGGGFIYEAEDELVAAMDRLLLDPLFRDGSGHHGHHSYERNWEAEAHPNASSEGSMK